MKDSRLKRKLVAVYEWYYKTKGTLILRTKYRLRIMSPERTLRYIKKHNCSIARYGDGEFNCILGERNDYFQTHSNELANKLAMVFECKDKRLLLCVPRCLNTTRGSNEYAGDYWISWGKIDGHQKKIVNLIRSRSGRNYLFGDAQITRPYIDWVDDKRARRTFPMLKELWAGRDILIVEGDKTRLGVGNDLFAGARSIKRILAPAVNAFDYYGEIKKAVLSNYHGELIIIALGPTATVLAAELAVLDMQALDMGNVDVEYEWYLRGAIKRVAIPGKFVNEAKDGHEYIATCDDEVYLSQIIDKIGC